MCFSKNFNLIGLTSKAAIGKCSLKKVFWGVFLRGNLRCVLECTTSAEKKSCPVEIGGTMAKLGVLLKICLCLG